MVLPSLHNGTAAISTAVTPGPWREACVRGDLRRSAAQGISAVQPWLHPPTAVYGQLNFTSSAGWVSWSG